MHNWMNSEPEATDILKDAKKSSEMKGLSIQQILEILVSEDSITQEDSDEIISWINSKPEGMEHIKSKKGKIKMKGKSQPPAPEISYENIEIQLSEAVASGEMSDEEAEIKLTQIKEKKDCDANKSNDNVSISAEQIRMMIYESIKNGKITEDQAKVKYSQLVSK